MPSPLHTDNFSLQADSDAIPEDILFGSSAAMRDLRHQINKVAPISILVLLQGANGTGKGLMAREIHRRSQQANGPFVTVNCAAIPTSLLESEMFGHEKGAFTGAHVSRIGLAKAADHGTLFLDEIADLGLALQAKLLHFLQDGSYSSVGGQQRITTQARIICATNRDLESEVARGAFRKDLFYRISGVTLQLATLKERRKIGRASCRERVKMTEVGV